jgi:hypothetical protein
MFENIFDIGTYEIKTRVEGTRTILTSLQEGKCILSCSNYFVGSSLKDMFAKSRTI